MGFESLIKQIESGLDNLRDIDLDKIDLAKFQSWNNLGEEDFKKSVADLINLLEKSLDLNIYDNYPFNIINAVQINLNKTTQQVQQLAVQTSQQNFINAFTQVESYRTNLRTWGIYTHVNYGFNIEEKVNSFNSDYQNLISIKKEFEDLKNNVQKLIEPAVSGSLSKSFSERKEDLKKTKFAWMVISIVAAIISLGLTIYVVDSLLASIEIPNNATTEQIQKIVDQRPSYGLMNLIRLGILFPIYSFFLYSFSQYKKERNLEEEYAHRAAVATSLPNYGDLAVDNTVKDQIVSSASNVVFRSPIERKTPDNVNIDGNKSIDQLKSLIDSLKQLLEKKTE